MSAEDARFVREGRSLRDWLPELLGPDRITRRRAENAVSAMHWGVPVADQNAFLHLPPDRDAHLEAFGKIVAEILADPEFPGERFLRQAVQCMKKDAAATSRLSEMMTRLSLNDPPLDPRSEQELTERIARARAEEDDGRLPNSHGTRTLHTVIENAGVILLRVPDVVRDALRDRDIRQTMADAIRKLGPAAVVFAPDLMASADGYIAFPDTLACIAQADRETVLQLLSRAKSPDVRVAYSAAATLANIGPNAARLVPPLIDELLAMCDASDRGIMILTSLAPIAPDRREVFDRVLAATRPQPPEIRPVEGYPQYTYDAALQRRGEAIVAIGYFRAFADEAVTSLAAAMDTFKEYDPDWGYENGKHGRVISTLSRLIPASSAAVPSVVRHLRDEEGEVDWRIIRFLGELGPAAREALPALHRLQAELSPPDVGSEGSADKDDDPLAWAIQRIEAVVQHE